MLESHQFYSCLSQLLFYIVWASHQVLIIKYFSFNLLKRCLRKSLSSRCLGYEFAHHHCFLILLPNSFQHHRPIMLNLELVFEHFASLIMMKLMIFQFTDLAATLLRHHLSCFKITLSILQIVKWCPWIA